MSITALVHTRNSERFLDACLKSLSWCDEIWVIDMGSEDKTLDIAAKRATKVYSVNMRAFTGPTVVEMVRNDYMRKVKTDWTLIVDSDEEVPPTLGAKIKEVMLTEGVAGYFIPRMNVIWGRPIGYSGFWPDYLLRLFRTGTATQSVEIHSQPTVEGKVEYLPAHQDFALIHHHYESIEQMITRHNIYTGQEVAKLIAIKPNYTPVDALRAFFAQFHTRFFAQKGYKDGMYGLALSLMLATYSMEAVLKAWETTKLDAPVNLEDVENEIGDGCRATSYWVANEELQAKASPLRKLMLILRRKISS